MPNCVDIVLAGARKALRAIGWGVVLAPSGAISATPALDYYPPAAAAAGVEGKVTLYCARDAHFALKDCSVRAETPRGYGFGQAALDMAAASPANPDVRISNVGVHSPIEVAFSLHPKSIKPDLTRMGHVVLRPMVLEVPDVDVYSASYPERAEVEKVSGSVVLECRVAIQGDLEDCQTLEETPAGYGFAAAAHQVASSYQLLPMLRDGHAVDGAMLDLPVSFRWGPMTDSDDPDPPHMRVGLWRTTIILDNGVALATKTYCDSGRAIFPERRPGATSYQIRSIGAVWVFDSMISGKDGANLALHKEVFGDFNLGFAAEGKVVRTGAGQNEVIKERESYDYLGACPEGIRPTP